MKQYLSLTPERGHAIGDGWLPPPSPPTTTSPRYSKKRLLAIVAAVSTAVIVVLAITGHSKKNSVQLGRVGNFKTAPIDAASEQQHSDIANIDVEQQHSDIINIYPEIKSTDAAANRKQHSDTVIVWSEQRADDVEADAVPSLLDRGEIFLSTVFFYMLKVPVCMYVVETEMLTAQKKISSCVFHPSFSNWHIPTRM